MKQVGGGGVGFDTVITVHVLAWRPKDFVQALCEWTSLQLVTAELNGLGKWSHIHKTSPIVCVFKQNEYTQNIAIKPFLESLW